MKPKFYVAEIWIEGFGNIHYPPYLVIKKHLWWIFSKTIVDFGILSFENCDGKYQTAERYCNLLNYFFNCRKAKKNKR